MASKNISGAEYPLAKIFSSDFDYEIPSYQRPYSWMTDHASELFDDLYDFFVHEQDDSYFLGSIVLIKEDNSPHAQVIDGQQRLTTLTILLALLAHQFEDDERSDYENYIREPGRHSQGLAPKPRLALRERDRKFFADFVQQLRFEELLDLDTAQLDNEAQKNIKLNSKVLLERIETKFDGDKDKLRAFGAFVVQRCFLVAVSTPNRQSAFRVFSVMNSRGMDLQPTDIIKAETIGEITDQVEQDSYNDRWEDMEVALGRAGFNDLFVYIRMIYGKHKAKRALLEEFKEQVISRVPSSQALVGEVLEPYADALLVLKSNQYMSDTGADEVNWYLRWLNRIDNADWVPPAMLFLKQHRDNPEYVAWFFRQLERLAACMHVCARNVNQRVERYAEVITALEAQHGPGQPVEAVALTEAEKQSMFRALSEDIYTLTARRRNYVMLRLDSFVSDGSATYDASVLTIEHVLPQTVPEGSQWETDWPDPEQRAEWVHKLANLVPLNKQRNSAAQNYDFARKKSRYFQGSGNVSSYALTSQVLSEPEWTPDVVRARQARLLEVVRGGWDL